jgi:hypothetical protein
MNLVFKLARENCDVRVKLRKWRQQCPEPRLCQACRQQATRFLTSPGRPNSYRACTLHAPTRSSESMGRARVSVFTGEAASHGGHGGRSESTSTVTPGVHTGQPATASPGAQPGVIMMGPRRARDLSLRLPLRLPVAVSAWGPGRGARARVRPAGPPPTTTVTVTRPPSQLHPDPATSTRVCRGRRRRRPPARGRQLETGPRTKKRMPPGPGRRYCGPTRRCRKGRAPLLHRPSAP